MNQGYPLIDLGMNIVLESNSSLDQTNRELIRNYFLQFLNNQIPFESLCHYLVEVVGNCNAAEKIKQILSTQSDPIPLSPEIENIEGSRKKTRPWTEKEDNRLYMGIQMFGRENWTQISQYVGDGRTRSQCSQRWIRVLDPHISKSHWTSKEEQKLVQLVQKYGEQAWVKVANELGNRSDVQCRYKYHQLVRDGSILSDEHKEIHPENQKQEVIQSSFSNQISPDNTMNIQKPKISSQNANNFVSYSTQSDVNNRAISMPITYFNPPKSVPSIQETNIPLASACSVKFTPLSAKQNSDQFINQIQQKLDDCFHLASSTDLFRSENVFDSSLWVL